MYSWFNNIHQVTQQVPNMHSLFSCCISHLLCTAGNLSAAGNTKAQYSIQNGAKSRLQNSFVLNLPSPMASEVCSIQ